VRYWDGQAWTTHQQPATPAAAGPPGPYFVAMLGSETGPVTFEQLRQMIASKQLTTTTQIRTETGGWFPAGQLPGLYSDKEWLTALLLSILVGGFGVDQFYLGNTGLGIAKLLTLGACGVWTLIDIVRIAMNTVPDSKGMPLRK
jgi:TM2 domain-containing membrane protein YozV